MSRLSGAPHTTVYYLSRWGFFVARKVYNTSQKKFLSLSPLPPLPSNFHTSEEEEEEEEEKKEEEEEKEEEESSRIDFPPS